jgi:hypothetical protein
MGEHPVLKPRMRQLVRSTRYTVDLRPIDKPRLMWLCVGAGCYVYDESAERAYARWQAKRAARWVEHTRANHMGITCVKH